MTSPLDNLAGPGKPLRHEAPDPVELAGLERSGRLRLADAKNPANSLENRYVVFQVLPHTLGLGAGVWRVLDKCHNLRNQGECGFLHNRPPVLPTPG